MLKIKTKKGLLALLKDKFRIGFLLAPVFLLFAAIAVCDIKPAQAAGPVPVYSFWHKTYESYFLTISETKKDSLSASSSWTYKGIKFYAFSRQADAENLSPVYHFWNSKSGYHFYTISLAKKDELLTQPADKGWVYKDIAFYAYAANQADSTPVYELGHIDPTYRYYLTSPGEKVCLLNYYSSKFRDLDTAWWVPATGADLDANNQSCITNLGPRITVGLWPYTRSDLEEEAFKIEGNKDYIIKDDDGKIIATVSKDKMTRVKYNGSGELKIYESIPETIVDGEVTFSAADGRETTMIFDAHQPNSSYDEFRGSIRLRYSDNNGTKRIWVINILPLEHYAWGNGELSGTGDMDYNRTMAVIYRTYGYWKIRYSTKYAIEGFDVTDDSGSQIYRGYEWEEDHSRIKQAVKDTAGKIMKHGSDIALSPYSSWTDGRTRSFYERWGSREYPWCQSVKDPYGKHPTMSTAQLVAAGNHMVGLSANGAVKLAANYGWSWSKILSYYFTDIKISKLY